MVAHGSGSMHLMKEALVRAVFILSLSILSANPESLDSISFNFPSFQQNDRRITFQGNAAFQSNNADPSNSTIQLTLGAPLAGTTYILGRAIYHQPLHLWDSSTGNLANFVSQFDFTIDSQMHHSHADGLVFFLAPSGSQIPKNSAGGLLGLTSSIPNSTSSSTPFVAVEFDTFYDAPSNAWDPPCNHVGIDVNSLASVNDTCVSWMDDSILYGKRLHAQVTYDSRAMSLSVLFGDNGENSTSLYYQPINLTEHLPEWVDFGFSATTGRLFEAHTILSWEFNSSLRILDKVNDTTNATINTPTGGMTRGKKSKSSVRGAILGVSCSVSLIIVAGSGWYVYKLRRNRNDESGEDVPGNDEGFEQSKRRKKSSQKGRKKSSHKVLAVDTSRLRCLFFC